MKQPDLVRFCNSSFGSSFRNEFDGRAKETKNNAYTFDGQMEAVSKTRAFARLDYSKRADSKISKGEEIKEAAKAVLLKQTPLQTAESVKNNSDKIAQNLKERSEKGAARSAGKRLIDAFIGGKENDEKV